MARKTRKVGEKKGLEQEVMVIQILETERDQLTKIGALVWSMTGAAIGCLFILASIMVLVFSLVPGMPQYPLSGSLYLISYSVIITFVLTIFYGMMGGLMGGLMSSAINWILQKMGGIKLKVRILR